MNDVFELGIIFLIMLLLKMIEKKNFELNFISFSNIRHHVKKTLLESASGYSLHKNGNLKLIPNRLNAMNELNVIFHTILSSKKLKMI